MIDSAANQAEEIGTETPADGSDKAKWYTWEGRAATRGRSERSLGHYRGKGESWWVSDWRSKDEKEPWVNKWEAQNNASSEDDVRRWRSKRPCGS